MRSWVTLGDVPRGFFRPGEWDAGLPANAWPRLVAAGVPEGVLSLGGENANTVIELDNGDGLVSELFRDPPLLQAAVIHWELEGEARQFAGRIVELELSTTAWVGVEF